MAGVSAGPDAFFSVNPAALAKPECFAVKRGELEDRINADFYKVEVRQLLRSINDHFPEVKPLGSYGEVVCGPFGTAIKLSDYVDEGVPLLRISNISNEGNLDFQDLVFITHALSEELSSTQVSDDDIIISQRGTLGITAVVSSEFPVFNISANLIAIKNLSDISPRYVQLYLSSALGEAQISRLQSGQVHPKITTDDVASVLIPNVPNQVELVADMDAARAERKAKLAQADALLAGVDDFVLDALGIMPPINETRRVFAVRRLDMENLQFSPSRHVPELQSLLNELRSHAATSKTLGDYMEINPRADVSELDDDDVVGFIPMSAVADGAIGEYTIMNRPLEEVRKGYTPFRDGDVLWAKITPCMQNGKSCIVEDLPNGAGFGSTEFHVLRVEAAGISKEFVKEFVSQKTLRQVATNTFTGSAGQQRVPSDFLASLPFPKLSEGRQNEIVAEIQSIRSEARRLRAEAEAGWDAAKARFEAQLLG